jgi:hypothetical protein
VAAAHPPANVAGSIYGEILAMSSIATLSLDDSLSAWRLLGGLVATMLVFWLAHAYAEIVSLRVVTPHRLSTSQVLWILESEWPLVQASVPGVLALALAGVGVYGRQAGVVAALALGAASLFVWGTVIGHRSGFGWLATLGSAAGTAALGGGLVGLELALH